MHVIILPSSGVLEADYTSFSARAANGLDDVPGPRRGHTSTVIGDSIYMIGGEGGAVQEEKGRVWIYHTVQNTWAFLDPVTDSVHPVQRTGHAAASSDLPGSKTAVTYREKAPQAPADPSKVVPEPAESDSWGTIFVVGGRDVSSRNLSTDALAFDVRTRTWRNIPTPPGQPREGASLSLVGDRLYRFGGSGVETFNSGATDFLDASHVWRHAEVPQPQRHKRAQTQAS
jgi:N-acetylneuraminic acid mutarotase